MVPGFRANVYFFSSASFRALRLYGHKYVSKNLHLSLSHTNTHVAINYSWIAVMRNTKRLEKQVVVGIQRVSPTQEFHPFPFHFCSVARAVIPKWGTCYSFRIIPITKCSRTRYLKDINIPIVRFVLALNGCLNAVGVKVMVVTCVFLPLPQ